jgi:hypothetical protein
MGSELKYQVYWQVDDGAWHLLAAFASLRAAHDFMKHVNDTADHQIDKMKIATPDIDLTFEDGVITDEYEIKS